METRSDGWSSGLSAYIIVPYGLKHSRSTHARGTPSSTSAHRCSSISTSVAAPRAPIKWPTSHPSTDIDVITRGPGTQSLGDHTYGPSTTHPHAALSFDRSYDRQLKASVSDIQEHRTYQRRRDNITDQSSVTSLHNQALPIRTRPSSRKQCELLMPQENHLLGKRYTGTILKSTPSSTQSATSEWNYVVRRVVLQHSRHCLEHDDLDETSLSQIFKNLAITAIVHPNERTLPSVIPHLRPRMLGPRPSTSQTTFGKHAFNAPDSAKQGSESKGKGREQPSEDDPYPNEDGDDRRRRRSRDPVTASEEQTSFKLRCPFLMSPQYRHLKECSRCLIADLRTLEKLIQHLKRTHNWCVKCAKRFPGRAKFASSTAFDDHRPRDNQCHGCHEVFGDVQLLQQHKQDQPQCSLRDRRSEEKKYKDIWKSIVPNQECPDIHRANIRNDSQALDLLAKLSQSCKNDILQQLTLVLEQDDSMNTETIQNNLQLVSNCLGSTSEIHYQRNHDGAAYDALQNDEVLLDSFNDFDDFDDFDSFDALESSQRSNDEFQHESNASPRLISQTCTPDYRLLSHQHLNPLDNTMRLSNFEASNLSAQDFANPQLLEFGAQMQSPIPPSAYHLPEQPSTLQNWYAAQIPCGPNWMLAGTVSPWVAPHQNYTIGQIRPDTAYHPGYPSERPSFQTDDRSHVLGHDTGGPSGIRRGTVYPYGSVPVNSDTIGQSQQVSEQDRTPRLYSAALASSTPVPLPPDTDSIPNQDAVASAFAIPADTRNAPWIDRTTAQNGPALDRQQQRYQIQNSHRRPTQPRSPPQQPSKRMRHSQYP